CVDCAPARSSRPRPHQSRDPDQGCRHPGPDHHQQQAEPAQGSAACHCPRCPSARDALRLAQFDLLPR
ncbi:hypothetical protein BN1708_018518, partial [Verticillium longisporum]